MTPGARVAATIELLNEIMDGAAESGRGRPADLVATLYHRLGVGGSSQINDRLGREVPLIQGEVIRQLLA